MAKKRSRGHPTFSSIENFVFCFFWHFYSDRNLIWSLFRPLHTPTVKSRDLISGWLLLSSRHVFDNDQIFFTSSRFIVGSFERNDFRRIVCHNESFGVELWIFKKRKIKRKFVSQTTERIRHFNLENLTLAFLWETRLDLEMTEMLEELSMEELLAIRKLLN